MSGGRQTTTRSRFDELFDGAVPHILGQTHTRDVVPRTGGRWPISAALLLSPTQALPLTSVVEQMLPLVGPHHFLTGRPAALHVTVRALEHRRENIPLDDPVVARYLSAIRRTASQCPPVRLESTGMTLTTTGVMAAFEPADGAANRLTAVLEQELGPDGWCEAGFDRTIWYATVKGHEILPTGGQQTCPLMARRSARWWPGEVPTKRREWPHVGVFAEVSRFGL